ncbi:MULTISPECIES: flagellar protein FlaG [unclassified Pseudomonas]|uniref:flagellar protein FlaG n=1 Tax=unclassified Pseudomonas TaxID=196821 RepID=UPI002AC9B87F|nr:MULTISPECIES: flagellar protein FlaG [unclassified Pseudomonas]MEB0041419.1 flagellar protein FlaG [Pseudomonas sp. MH10]MEB0078695.1 flagellar protein FlaG [Pseudomonas sp. MH10out]MEB0093247.1 flagellar protein FlaG [Pseudomonas sp. CCI4.2]MEB0103785.1 flagellar protein FlaG [Pseudomonas sp. CCI3.2]MEB0121166.1 flagellar protein FlaG [Pseudomonas sp. CCI1.2]
MDMSAKLNSTYPTPVPVTTAAAKPAAPPPVATPATTVAAMSADKSTDADKLKLAVQQIEKFVDAAKRNLEFSIDERSGKVVVKVIASETGEVIRQLPSAEVLKLADSMKDASSVLFSGKA